MNKRIFSIISMILLLILAYSCSKTEKIEKDQDTSTTVIDDEAKQTDISSLSEKEAQLNASLNQGNIFKSIDLISLREYISDDEINQIGASISSDDYKNTQDIIAPIIEKIEKERPTSKNEVDNIKILKNAYISALLNEGTSYYDEEEKAKEAIVYIEQQLLESPDYVDPIYSKYYLGYANEIIREFDNALEYYNAGLELVPDIEKNKELKAMFLNQIGHIYDLRGEREKANEYYVLAEDTQATLLSNLINRGRYEMYAGNYDSAKSYFEKVLSLSNAPFVKSEMHSNLATILLTQSGADGITREDYEQKVYDSIAQSEAGINQNKDYPYNYTNIGIAYLYLGSSNKDDQEELFKKGRAMLNSALEIYPKSARSYKYLGIMDFIEDKYDSAIANFKAQAALASQEMMLMRDDQIILEKDGLYDLARSYALNVDAVNSAKTIDALLEDGNSKSYYDRFIVDFFKPTNTPFEKVASDSSFGPIIKKYMDMYRK